MKYRIVNGDDDLLPYVVQRLNEKSFFPYWKKIIQFKNWHEAESFIKKCAERHSKYEIGGVVFEYDESDVVVDKLKNQQNSESDGRVYAQSDVPQQESNRALQGILR
jgi:hypothetical protein